MTNDKLEELYKKYHRFVKDVAYKILGDPYLAQDVCHDVFMKLSDEWIMTDLQPEIRKEFLRVAAYHKALDYKYERWADVKTMDYESLVKDKKKISYLQDEFVLDEDVTERLFVHQMLIRLRRENENWYMAILKKEIYHEPVELIAQELGVEISVVYVWLHRAKAWIKRKYGRVYRNYF